MSETKHVLKFLVTGGAGFIGSHLVDSLMDRGYSVRVLDDLSNGSLKNLERWLTDPRFEFVQGDLGNLDVAQRGVEDIETVFHMRALGRTVFVLHVLTGLNLWFWPGTHQRSSKLGELDGK